MLPNNHAIYVTFAVDLGLTPKTTWQDFFGLGEKKTEAGRRSATLRELRSAPPPPPPPPPVAVFRFRGFSARIRETLVWNKHMIFHTVFSVSALDGNLSIVQFDGYCHIACWRSPFGYCSFPEILSAAHMGFVLFPCSGCISFLETSFLRL